MNELDSDSLSLYFNDNSFMCDTIAHGSMKFCPPSNGPGSLFYAYFAAKLMNFVECTIIFCKKNAYLCYITQKKDLFVLEYEVFFVFLRRQKKVK